MSLLEELRPTELFVPLAELPPIEALNCRRPDPGFVESLRAIQIHPITMVRKTSGELTLVSGNRRVYAAHLGNLPGLRAWVYNAGEINPALIQVAENHHRKPNPFSDMDAIIPLLTTRSVEEIASELHLPVNVVKAAIKLVNLAPGLLARARSGDLAVTTALSLAGKPTSVQQAVAERHPEGKITADMIREAATAVVQATMPTLPIPALPGGPGITFGRALDTEKGIKLIFFNEGAKHEFVVPAKQLYELVAV